MPSRPPSTGSARLGAEVIVQAEPVAARRRRDASLAVEWLAGWVGAACEQEPALAADAEPYRRRRLQRGGEPAALAVTVGHADLLVLP